MREKNRGMFWGGVELVPLSFGIERRNNVPIKFNGRASDIAVAPQRKLPGSAGGIGRKRQSTSQIFNAANLSALSQDTCMFSFGVVSGVKSDWCMFYISGGLVGEIWKKEGIRALNRILRWGRVMVSLTIRRLLLFNDHKSSQLPSPK